MPFFRWKLQSGQNVSKEENGTKNQMDPWKKTKREMQKNIELQKDTISREMPSWLLCIPPYLDPWKKTKREMQKNIELQKDTIRTFKKIISSLEALMKNLQTHQAVVRVSKGAGAIAGVVGATLVFFPPTLLAGIITGIVAGVTGLGTSGRDWYKTRKVRKQVEKYAKEAAMELDKLKKEAMELQASLTTLGNVLDGAGYTRIATQVGNTIAQGVITLGDDVAAGARAGSALVRGGLVASKDGAKVALNATRVVGNVLGAVGAGLGVIDAVYTAVKENTSLELAQTLIKELEQKKQTMEDNVKEMEEAVNNI